MNFANQVVVISGASRGLGKALALGFGERGATLGICARDTGRLSAVAEILKKMAVPHVAFNCDLSDEFDAQSFVERVIERYRRIDVVINNASLLGPRSEVAAYPSDAWREVIDVNLNGAFYLTKFALKTMKAQRSGSLIHVSSSVGRRGRSKWGAYAVSKFGLEGLSEVLADELREYGIRSNTVNPGAIATDMRREAYPTEDQTTLKRPEDILDVFYYLASGESEGVSGQRFDAQQFSRPDAGRK